MHRKAVSAAQRGTLPSSVAADAVSLVSKHATRGHKGLPPRDGRLLENVVVHQNTSPCVLVLFNLLPVAAAFWHWAFVTSSLAPHH